MALLILIERVVAGHVQDVEIGEPVPVQVAKGRIAAGTDLPLMHLGGDIFEFQLPQIAVENALVPSFGKQMIAKGIGRSSKRSVRSFFVDSVFPNFDDEQ